MKRMTCLDTCFSSVADMLDFLRLMGQIVVAAALASDCGTLFELRLFAHPLRIRQIGASGMLYQLFARVLSGSEG